MSWESRLVDLFDDLEQQAAGLALQARDAEVAEAGRAQYAEVELLGRLHASLGRSVVTELHGAGQVSGRLARVGRGWALLVPEEAPGQEWLVNLGALLETRGLSPRTSAEAGWGVATRVSIGSALRRVAEAPEACLLSLTDGSTRRGRLGRVGADFVELVRDGTPSPRDAGLVPFGALALVRPGTPGG